MTITKGYSMESSWKEHLESQGAIFEQNTVIHYGNASQELASVTTDNKTVITELSHYGLIKISGTESQSFLQSQFSNDVNLVSESQAQLNSYCSPKGRVLALFNLFQINSDYYLQLPKALLASILKRLTMFKMRADVELLDVSDSLLCIGLSGSAAESILNKQFNNVPNSTYSSATQNDITVIRINDDKVAKAQPRFLLFANTETLTSFWKSNQDQLTPVSFEPWSYLDIKSGIPSITDETVDSFVPQMLNLQLINAVSFKKGCYPGQEIVARTQYLGKLKKRLYRLKSDDTNLLQPGTDLSTEQAEDEQSKGKIVNCQTSPTGGIEALAVLQISCIEQGSIIAKDNKSIKFSIQELPYSFESKDENSAEQSSK